jgi:hypothetical protein
VILLSPILTHWGLQLEFDESQPAGPNVVDGAARIPVDLPGRFAVAGGDATCAIEAAGVVARCRIGRGRVLAVADAALLDAYEPHPDSAPRSTGCSRRRSKAGKRGIRCSSQGYGWIPTL